MSRHIADYTYRDILALQDDVRASLRDGSCLEQAAQRVADRVWEAFRESAVLVRCFVALPYHRLPAGDQAFVRRSAEANGAAESLREDTIVLSLLGTRGCRPEWDRRESSRGHLGIPLISGRFVEAIPMVARLLHEMGVDPGWFDAEDHRFVDTNLGSGQVGVFFVPDAAGSTDAQGRPIISAQDFVREHGVKTVFGLSGTYGDGTVFTLLVFTRESLDKETVDAFTHLIVLIKAATADLVRSGALFA